VARQSGDTTLLEGAPLLAVEVLSPTDKQEEIDEKIDEYLACGVQIVWVVNPHHRTVLEFRPNAEPVLFNATQDLTAEPFLPGFKVPVAALFE
jgi:Uma2 family endonuclease